MQKRNIAVLLTCHNRRNKTITCLASLFRANVPTEYLFDVFLTDDGSADGTEDSVKALFPQVKVLRGNGNLFWAGGMRLAWETAMQEKPYDAFLLLNDDVELFPDFFMNLLETEAYSLIGTGKRGIYSGVTVDKKNGRVTYGGYRIIDKKFILEMQLLQPLAFPRICDVANANVLWVSKEVVNQIGIFDPRFTHGIADYDYSLRARNKKIPLLLASAVSGICPDDHGKNWKDHRHSLKQRMEYLKSPKGLAYNEYLYYIRKHFPLYLPYSFVMLWVKTLFPFIWDRVKRR